MYMYTNNIIFFGLAEPVKEAHYTAHTFAS